MALCASGEMSLGGSTTNRSVNLELGRSATASICMNETDVRTLAEVPSGAISMNCFYGKSSGPPPPTTLGQVYEGGYYTGVINIGGGICYYMIVAPNATGCATCAWKTTATATSGSCSLCNGYLNTYTTLNNGNFPAGNFTATRTINGFSDWYLPAIAEDKIMYDNKGSMPSGQGYVTSGGASAEYSYWSSTVATDGSGIDACYVRFDNGLCAAVPKTFTYKVRAIRRERV